MKILFLPILLLILFSGCSEPEFIGKFSYSPENPKPGEEITVMYSADSTNLKGSEEIDMQAYLYGKELDESIDVEMEKKEGGFIAKFKTNEETKGVLIKFDSDENLDNNNKEGYVIHLYNDNDKPIAGTYAGYAEALSSWGARYADLERNDELSLELLKKDLENNPEIKEEFSSTYFTLLSRSGAENSDSIITAELQGLEKNITEENAVVLADWYGTLKDTANSSKYKAMIKEKFPKSEYMQSARYREFYNEKNIDKKLEMAAAFEKDFPESELTSNHYDIIANYYRDNKEYKKAEEFLRNNKDKPSVYRFFAVSNKMIEDSADLDTALEIARMGVERGKNELQNPKGKRPEYAGEKGWLEEREYLLALNLYAEGKILHLKNRNEEALPKLAEAVNYSQQEEVDINQLYAEVLIEEGKHKEAMTALEGFIKKGKSSNDMRDMLKTAYIKNKGSEEGFENYIAEFEKAAQQNLEEKLKTEMINEKAPEFKLTDLDGNEVSLNELKGKTVILDFWATWCGPCLSSFPGMKNAVERYSNNPDVKFLFINAWERVPNVKENADKFIEKNQYPFHVLLDDQNKVIESYKVTGIPTKFVIDKSGNIRFKSIGFGGNTDKMVEELSLMIAMIK